jgi:hypothetical protein
MVARLQKSKPNRPIDRGFMSKMLSLENMLVAAHNSNMPGAQEFAKDACLLASELGQKLAAHLCVDGPVICDFDPTEMSAEVLGGFAPRWKDQPLPAVLRPSS